MGFMEDMCELAGVPVRARVEEAEGMGSEEAIKVLRDTDYRDTEAFFKMVQILKGLAAASEKDEMAKKFLSSVSDALTTAAKSMVKESVNEEAGKPKFNPKYAATKLDSIPELARTSARDIRDGKFGEALLDVTDILSATRDVYREFVSPETPKMKKLADELHRVIITADNAVSELRSAQ